MWQAGQVEYPNNFSFTIATMSHNTMQRAWKQRVRPQICREFVLCATLACANVLPAARSSNNDRIAATKRIAISRAGMLHGVCATWSVR